MHTIRPEEPRDIEAIRRVNQLAFGRDAEASLVDALRAAGNSLLSVVADDNGEVVGHVMFSPMSIEPGGASRDTACLAPIAVTPSRQLTGIGGSLLEAGLAALRELGYRGVVLVGHPSYYPRFGFRPAREFGLHYQDDRDAFMAIELYPGALDGVSGVVRFAPEFDDID